MPYTNDELNSWTQAIILNSFPDLLAESIEVEYAHIEDSFLVYGKIGKGFFIEVDDVIINAPDRIIVEGGIVHELCHIARDRLKSRIDSWLYKISDSYRLADERATDIEAIVRGYLKHLVAFEAYVLPLRKAPTEGLTMLELTKLQKST